MEVWSDMTFVDSSQQFVGSSQQTVEPTPRVDEQARRMAQLEQALENVQAARPVAMEVLRLADDPDADARKVAACIEKDPILVAQMLRLANSAAFGMAHHVKTTQIAVAVLGFSTVRSVAILVASGLRNLRHPAPEGFWEHSAAVAAACSILSRHHAVTPGDGFALGLIHDLGIPMLNSIDPVAHGAARETSDDAALCRREELAFGMSHATAAATVLASWSFPPSLVRTIAEHHDGVTPTTGEAALLAAGDAIAHLAADPGSVDDAERLRSAGFADADVRRLVADVGGRSGGILAGLLR